MGMNKDFEKQIEERLQAIVDNIYVNPQPLMDKPLESEYVLGTPKIMQGCDIHTKITRDKSIKNLNSHVPPKIVHKEIRWNYPCGVEEKIKDDRFYCVWAYDVKDPRYMNPIIHNIRYIEECTDEKMALIEAFEKISKRLQIRTI